MSTKPLVPVVLLHAEADLEEPDALSLDDAIGIVRDLRPLLVDDDLDLDVRIRALRAIGTATEGMATTFRALRGTFVLALFSGGMSYPVIGERFGVSGERARQWATDAPTNTKEHTA